MHVQALHVEPGAGLDALDQLRRSGGCESELGALMAGEDVAVGIRSDPGDHADQYGLRPAGRHGRLQPVDVVGVVHGDQPDAVFDGHRDLLVGLRVAVQHDQRRIDARLQRSEDLAAAGDVETETLLDDEPLHGRAREGLRREYHPGPGPAGGEFGGVLPGSGPHRLLGDDEDGRAELGGQVVGPAAADHEHSVGVQRAAVREQTQQVGRSRHVVSLSRGDAAFEDRQSTGEGVWHRDGGLRSGGERVPLR